MNKSKILYISHSSETAGAETGLLTLIKYLNRDLFEPVVILPSKGSLLAKMKNLGVKVYISPHDWWIKLYYQNSNLSTCLQSIIQIIELEKPDLVHTNDAPVLEGAIAAKIKNIPHIWHIRDILEGHPFLKPLFPLPIVYWLLDLLSDRVVAVSNAAKVTMKSIINSEKLITIYNGVDTNRLKVEEGNSIRKELAIPTDIVLVVTVGSIIEKKGYGNLLRAISLVKGKKKNIKFLIIGGGPPRNVQELNRRISRLKLQETVYYLGHRNDVPRIVSESDIFVLSSIIDAFPRSILEAMGLKKPIIATNSGGASEMILNNESGFIVPINDPEELCNKIIEISEDKEKIKRMGEEGHRIFRDNFRAEIHVKNIENLYKQVLNSKKSRVLLDKEKTLLDSFLKHYEILVEKTYNANKFKIMSSSWLWKLMAPFAVLYAKLSFRSESIGL